MVNDDSNHIWQPLSIAEVAKLLSNLSIPWWIAGGYAIELFAGKRIRNHQDIDVAILRKDQHTFQDYLSEWDIHKTNQPGLKPWPVGEYLKKGVNQVWCRPTSLSAWALEVMFIESEGDRWYFRRNSNIGGPLSSIGLTTHDSISYLAPEIQLLYKAGDSNIAKTQLDFDAALPLLNKSRKNWLITALKECYTEGHPWISRLE